MIRSAVFRPLHRLLNASISVGHYCSPAAAAEAKASSSSSSSSPELFVWSNKTAAARYFLKRPHYEQRVVPWVLQYYFKRHPESADKDYNKVPLAIDVGCGSGQITTELAKYCHQVVGVDKATEQIDLAKIYSRRPNIEYRVGAAENLSAQCGAHQADLVMAGVAAHFFDVHRFMEAARKSLRPGGVLGIVGYHACGYEGAGQEWTTAIDDFLQMQLGHLEVFAEVDARLKSHYRSLEFPFNDTRYLSENMDVEWTHTQVDEFLNGFRHLFKHPERRVTFPESTNEHGTSLCRLHVFGVVGST